MNKFLDIVAISILVIFTLVILVMFCFAGVRYMTTKNDNRILFEDFLPAEKSPDQENRCKWWSAGCQVKGINKENKKGNTGEVEADIIQEIVFSPG